MHQGQSLIDALFVHKEIPLCDGMTLQNCDETAVNRHLLIMVFMSLILII